VAAPPRIARLPDELVNQIAAGEVVERPASVVKELVENALDARARSVRVDLEAGGKTLIRVRDDGYGMGREDARRALERHATSKLRALADLESLSTHGFRGEALPSIASVSHLVLRTREEESPAGTEVEVREGRLLEVRDAGHPRGTTVEVRDLFGGVPARRKFLRAEATETAHAVEALTLLALARLETGFALGAAGRTVLQAPPVAGLADRVYQLFGGSYLDDLVAVEGGAEWARVTGFVSRPDRPAAARPALRLFVNGRPVRDRALAKAVSEAYRGAGAREPRGEVLLFLDLPPHLVDVNVHPAKAEVRFADARTAFAAVEKAVREALSRGARAQAPRAPALSEEEPRPSVVAELGAPYSASALPAASTFQGSLLAEAAPTVLGQHRNTYVVASDGEDLLLVDQHTAHERVRFERLLEAVEAGRAAPSQRLLAPVVCSPAPALRALLEESLPELARLGYELEPFGGGAVSVHAVPAEMPAGDACRLLTDLLRDLFEREAAQWVVAGRREKLAATLACHSAVRAGEPLALPAMQAIVRELARTTHPTLCPHGRPTVMRVPRAEMAGWFGRGGWRRQ
jgi:DNA mismatch repair protein MutL